MGGRIAPRYTQASACSRDARRRVERAQARSMIGRRTPPKGALRYCARSRPLVAGIVGTRALGDGVDDFGVVDAAPSADTDLYCDMQLDPDAGY